MKPRRTTLAATLLAALAVSGCGDRGPGNATPADPAPGTSGAHPREVTALDCPNSRRESGDIDYVQFPGFADPEVAAARFLLPDESVAVDKQGADEADAWVLRPDGTARMLVTVHHGSGGWYPDTIEACAGEGPGATPPPASAAAPPTGISCDTNIIQAVFDFLVPSPGGPTSALEAARAWGGVDGDPVVLGADGHSAFVLRPDGTAHTELSLMGEAEHGWTVEGYQSCEGEGPTSASSTSVLLDIGHCWVEPFAFDGEEWALPAGRQFGWGGRYPDGVSGEGTALRASAFDDTLTYTDDGGGTLTFRLSSDPRTDLPGGGICD